MKASLETASDEELERLLAWLQKVALRVQLMLARRASERRMYAEERRAAGE